MKKVFVMIASFMTFFQIEAAHCDSTENYNKDFPGYTWLQSEIY